MEVEMPGKSKITDGRKGSKSVVEAIDKLRGPAPSQEHAAFSYGNGSNADRVYGGNGTAGRIGRSKSVVEAIDRLREGLGTGIDFSQLATGPEEVLLFASDDTIFLKVTSKDDGYFTSQAPLTDIWGRRLPGSVEAALPVKFADLGSTTTWPNPQQSPFNQPPVDNANVKDIGFAKNFFDFGHGNTIVTVGPSLPKLTLLKNGGAQFWESSCQAISQGTGIYEGARGLLAFVGSAYFPTFPNPSDGQKVVERLAQGFPARLTRCIKLVRKGNLG
jgi:hypothetical protein